jgi:hypothetical protein
MFSNIFGGFSFKMLSYTSIIATTFCWFVLANHDAASFFGVLSVLGLLVESYNVKVEASTDQIYKELERITDAASRRDEDSCRRLLDCESDIADCKDNCKLKSKR